MLDKIYRDAMGKLTLRLTVGIQNYLHLLGSISHRIRFCLAAKEKSGLGDSFLASTPATGFIQ